MRNWVLFLSVAGSFMAAPRGRPQGNGQTLKKLTEFDLPGSAGKRFDYLTIDTDDHYLLSAHLAAGQTYVIDLRSNRVVATVTDTPGAEGVEYIPEMRKFYTSNAGDNTVGVVDLRQMKVDRKSTRLNSSHLVISYAVFCLKKKKQLRSHSPSDGSHLLQRY